MQPEGENLVTLEDTSASAVLQKDGTVVCTHELLSPIGLLSKQAIQGVSKPICVNYTPSIVKMLRKAIQVLAYAYYFSLSLPS